MADKSSGLLGFVTERLRRYTGGGRQSLNRKDRIPARLPFLITPLGTRGITARQLHDAPALVGHTRDLSESGLTLLLPSVRAGDAYLTDGERGLEVKLELPGGPVTMHTSSVRFEQLQSKEAGCGYLLAVRINRMPPDERERYVAYLKDPEKRGGAARERRQAPSGRGAEQQQQQRPAQAGTWEALTPASLDKAFEQFLSE
jgi:hypothetical protein